MKTYKKAIEEILRFKEAFDSIDPKIPTRLVGELGEFYVLDRLEESGFKKLRHKGGQAGFDVYIEDNGKRIEVRTSLLKNEGLYPEIVQFFGWRVKNRNQKKEGKFDIMIGVALDETFKEPKFYIFTHEEAFSVQDVEIGRFKNVQKKIHLFESEEAYKEAIKSKPELVTKYEIYINEHQSEFLNRWDKIHGAS
jgi:hypothetical protein